MGALDLLAPDHHLEGFLYMEPIRVTKKIKNKKKKREREIRMGMFCLFTHGYEINELLSR